MQNIINYKENLWFLVAYFNYYLYICIVIKKQGK